MMKTIKTLAAVTVAIAAMAGAAEAGTKKHGFGYKYNPVWQGVYSHNGNCWYEYHSVPQTYYANVKYYNHGRPYWKRVKQVRYVQQPQKVCDWYRY
jgi:hypothetical protein